MLIEFENFGPISYRIEDGHIVLQVKCKEGEKQEKQVVDGLFKTLSDLDVVKVSERIARLMLDSERCDLCYQPEMAEARVRLLLCHGEVNGVFDWLIHKKFYLLIEQY